MTQRIRPEDYFTPEEEETTEIEKPPVLEIPNISDVGGGVKAENYFYKPTFNINNKEEERRIRPGSFIIKLITQFMDLRQKMLQVRREFIQNILK